MLFSTESLERTLEISVANIGQPHATFTLETASGYRHTRTVQADDHEAAIGFILDHIADQLSSDTSLAVGHRVVHGGPTYDRPTIITDDVTQQLANLELFDPEHVQTTVKLIRFFERRFPNASQVACFDTDFYRDLPTNARLLPLPRKLEQFGLRRYGFHGLSYTYLLEKFAELAGEAAANGRVVLAHLGSGASLAAVKDGKPLDMTMGFTPAGGIPMSTRSGDLDPGIAEFLHQQTGMPLEEFNRMVHFDSGLLGVSELSADMELLINESARNPKATDAVEFFCYQVRKAIGGLATVLGGVDSLIFAGGIGENAPLIREKVCQGLEYLGITLDVQRNDNHEFLISCDGSGVGVHVMHTDEASVIAAQTKQAIEREAT